MARLVNRDSPIPKSLNAVNTGAHCDDPLQILANLHTAAERLNAIRGEKPTDVLPQLI